MILTFLDAFCAKVGFIEQTTTYLVIYTCSLQRAIHFVYRNLVNIDHTYKNIFNFWFLLVILVLLLTNWYWS